MSSEWLFTKCCGFVPLRLGALILGYLITIINVAELFITTINLTFLKMIIESHHITDGRMLYMKYVLYAVAFIYACQMLMSINLLVGLHKRQRVHVEKFYKAYPVLMLIFSILLLIVFAINVKEYTEKEWLFHITDIAILFFQVYTIFVVLQCAKEMRSHETLRDDRQLVYSANYGPVRHSNLQEV